MPRSIARTKAGYAAVLLIVAYLGFVCSVSAAQAAGLPNDLPVKYKALVPGVDYGTYVTTDPPIFIHVVRADLKDPAVQLGAVLAQGRKSVVEMASAATGDDRDVVALVNGDYFDEEAGRGAWGPHIQNGELVLSPLKRKSAFMITADGQPLIDIPKLDMKATFTDGLVAVDILDVNRHDKLDKAGCHLLTPRAEVTHFTATDAKILVLTGGPLKMGVDVRATITRIADAGQTATIPADGFLLYCSEKQAFKPQQMKVGAKLVLNMSVTPACRELVGGGPAMIKNGGNRIDFLKEEFSPAHLAYLNNGRHPRSAVGYSRDKRYVYVVVVEGRIDRSEGLEVKGLGQVMMGLGCFEAMEFDGGGSSTLFTTVGLSTTSESELRGVANGLAVFRLRDKQAPEDVDMSDTNLETEDAPEETPEETVKPAPKKPGTDRIDDLINSVLDE
jgi:hypothetical protein